MGERQLGPIWGCIGLAAVQGLYRAYRATQDIKYSGTEKRIQGIQTWEPMTEYLINYTEPRGGEG